MDLIALRYKNERPLFVIALVVSIVVWLVVAITIVGLVYVAVGALFLLMAQALMLAAIKGNGVLITSAQLPELHTRLEAASKKLGLASVPEAYLLGQRGLFNAFATRFLGRNFIVLYAELLENCDEDSGAIDFIIGHEMGHHALGHLKWRYVVFPGLVLPLVGPAYSRACEYSCDAVGQAVVDGKPDAAASGLAVLAAGGRYAKRMSIDAFMAQGATTGTFWQAVVELNSSHPFLPKRIAAVRRRQNAANVPQTGRNPFSYVLAPFFAFSAGGGAGTVLLIVAIIGILAAIAIPNFLKYQERARGLTPLGQLGAVDGAPAGLEAGDAMAALAALQAKQQADEPDGQEAGAAEAPSAPGHGNAMELSGKGSLDPDAVQGVVDKHKTEIAACYARALPKIPSLSGTATIEWIIAKNGSVRSVRDASVTPNPKELTACMFKAIRGWRFPKPRGGTVTVAYSFGFADL